jgi:hypothetical protein
MASVVLSGDTSGSITVSAPAISGSNTQTLVATTGTLAPIVSGTTITLTNQTAPDFTNIPSWVKRITLMFNGVSPNSTGTLLVQLGDSGGYETTGYGSSMSYLLNATVAATTNVSTGILAGTYGSASAAYNGLMILTTLGSNVWVASCNLNDSGSARTFLGSGAKTLSDTLTSVRLYIDGTQQFDAGSINILYE